VAVGVPEEHGEVVVHVRCRVHHDGGDGGELGDGVAQRVQEADGPCDPVEEDEEAVDGAQVAVGRERREVDAEAGRGGRVEDAPARPGVGADGEHHPVAGPEAPVQVLGATAGTQVRAVVAPRPAHGAEAVILGHVVGEQPAGDVLD